MAASIKSCAIGMAIVVAAAIGAPAQATLISGNFNVTASGFGPGAPFDPVTGTVTYSFDNAAAFADVTTGFTVTGLDVAVTLGPGMTYVKGTDQLVFGDLVGTVNGVGPGTNDWGLVIDNVSTAPTFFDFLYATTTIRDHVLLTFTGSLTPVAHVPEPTTLALLALGGLGLLVTKRVRRRA
jgi:PEP-CTERM motif-containing protein